MIRLDGRKPTEVRPIRKSSDLIFSASSSTQLSIGSTTILVAVFNNLVPDNKERKLILEFDSFDQICNSEIINLCKISTDIMLKENLNFLVEYQITINIFLIEDDGNLLTVLLNAISQSLKEIRILNSKEIIFGGIGLENGKKEIFVDPSKIELELIEQELYFAITFNAEIKKLRFYQIINMIREKYGPITKIKRKIQKLALELGFHLFKIFN